MEQKKEIRTLWVVGDSTLSSFEDRYYYPRYGYGTQLQAYLDSEITVNNLALSGRSSKSYTTEPEYQTLLSGMCAGDFLLIGFGHNDEKTEEERFTSGKGSYLEEGTFAHSLYVHYIRKARAVGCTPVLCTPIVRRTPDGNWTQQELHVTGDVGAFTGGDYAQCIRELGAALLVPVVDMTAQTKALYDKMTPAETLYLHAWPSDQAASVDNTHTNIWGARVNAYLCLWAVRRLGIRGLSEHVTGMDADFLLPDQKQYLVCNPDYRPAVFHADFGESRLWPKAGMWQGTVFGDLLAAPSPEQFTLEPAGEGGIHIAVRGNTGKISPVSDGFAMYYVRIPEKADFVLSANARINDCFLNDQVSFGLMVRDDLYLDEVTADTLGDYVAAGPLMLTHGAQAWNCFARKSGVLTRGGTLSRVYEPGETVALRIESTADGYACTFGGEQTVTGGFDFKLTRVDPAHVYAGMFVARNADITFTDIQLEIK